MTDTLKLSVSDRNGLFYPSIIIYGLGNPVNLHIEHMGFPTKVEAGRFAIMCIAMMSIEVCEESLSKMREEVDGYAQESF